MNGYFDCSVMDARGLQDEDFAQARRDGEIMSLLGELPVEQRAFGRNRIFDNMAGYLLHELFSLPNCASPYYNNDGSGNAALSFLCLMTTDSDTTDYQENSTQSQISMHAVSGTANASSGAKRFEEDQITGWTTWSDAGKRQAVYFRNRFLYSPTQGASNNIRSIGLFFNSDGDSTGTYSIDFGRLGRIRLKDAAGVPIIMNKTSSQVLVVEYTFALVSM